MITSARPTKSVVQEVPCRIRSRSPTEAASSQFKIKKSRPEPLDPL
jgi:hypothetical protein